MKRNAALLIMLAALACGDGTGPTDVPFGVTTFVVLANPIVNDLNEATVPTPGTTRSGVNVSVAGGPSGSTDANGVVVLSPITAGTKTMSLSGGGASGQVSVSIADQDLREVAVALSGNTAQLMANVLYAFGGTVVEIAPSMSLAEVNDALSQSNTIVFFKAGTYTGDLQFSGSNVTLFGEGSQGGSVTLSGNVTVGGSANRIRGARITGNLSVPGSDFGMSFSRVVGTFDLSGSNGALLNNGFCSTVTISGSGTRLLGNAGLAPIPKPTTGC
ncbi:MAG: hypothetical protein HYW06_03790 [Gemmatimonadetes bacterium]|nr:hypothetical protein [Gemmatimonadota bacterium]